MTTPANRGPTAARSCSRITGGRAGSAGPASPGRWPRPATTVSIGIGSPGWCGAAAPRGWPCASPCDERARGAARTGRTARLPGTHSPWFADRGRRRPTANPRGLRAAPCAVRLSSVRAPAKGGSLSSLTVRALQVRPLRRTTPGDGPHGTYQEGGPHHDAQRREQPHQARTAGEGPTGTSAVMISPGAPLTGSLLAIWYL